MTTINQEIDLIEVQIESLTWKMSDTINKIEEKLVELRKKREELLTNYY